MFSLQWIVDALFGEQKQQKYTLIMVGSSNKLPTYHQAFLNPQYADDISIRLKQDEKLFKYRFRNYNSYYIQTNLHKKMLLSKLYIINFLRDKFNQDATHIMLFYEGDGHQNGDWDIHTQENPQGDRISLDEILKIWNMRQSPKDKSAQLYIFMNSHYASHWCYRLGGQKKQNTNNFSIFTAKQKREQPGLKKVNLFFKCILGPTEQFQKNYKDLTRQFIPIFIKGSKIVAKIYKHQMQLLQRDILIAKILQSNSFLQTFRGHGSSLIIRVNRNYENGQQYTGQYKNNLKHGKGTCCYQDGRRYIGQYKDGLKDGDGKFFWVGGDKYEGNWSKDKQNGIGTFTWACGDSYKGEWKDNEFNGQGTYRWADGRTYTGEYLMGKQHGKGKIQWPDGDSYDGQWEDDLYNGYGVFVWTDGRIFKGRFKDDKKNGEGIFLDPEGDRFEGIWKDDKLDGQVIYYKSNKQKQIRYYKNGRQIRNEYL